MPFGFDPRQGVNHGDAADSMNRWKGQYGSGDCFRPKQFTETAIEPFVAQGTLSVKF
jgi:hypothetical protein